MTEHEHDHETCRQLLASLGEYVDGALSQDLCAEMEKHMKDCESLPGRGEHAQEDGRALP